MEERVHELAAILTSRARVSVLGGKRLVARAVLGELPADDEVQELYRRSWTSAEYAEGVAAFLDKRPPDFPAARRR